VIEQLRIFLADSTRLNWLATVKAEYPGHATVYVSPETCTLLYAVMMLYDAAESALPIVVPPQFMLEQELKGYPEG